MALNQEHHASYNDNKPMNIMNIVPKDHYLESLVDNVSHNNFHIYYSKENSLFRKKIDKLNLKFYLESEKYLTNKTTQVKCQDSLFLILFEQISIYIEEIERLNTLLLHCKDDPNFIKERMEDNIRKQKEFETKELLVKTLKESNKKLERQLCSLITNEDKMKVEIERLKRQNDFYKDKLKIYLLAKRNEMDDIFTESFKEKYNSKHNMQMLNKSSSPNKVLELLNGNGSSTNIHSRTKNNNIHSVKNLKNYFYRKRNNSDQNQNLGQLNSKKKYQIIKTVKENAEIKRNERREHISPSIANPDDVIKSYDHQLDHLTQMEYFLQEMKQDLFNSKENDIQPLNNIDCFDLQDNSEINMKTEVISDIEDIDEGYCKNSAMVSINTQDRKKSQQPTKMNKINCQHNPITVDLYNSGNLHQSNTNLNNNNKHENGRLIYSNNNAKMKKTQSKIMSSNNYSNGKSNGNGINTGVNKRKR